MLMASSDAQIRRCQVLEIGGGPPGLMAPACRAMLEHCAACLGPELRVYAVPLAASLAHGPITERLARFATEAFWIGMLAVEVIEDVDVTYVEHVADCAEALFEAWRADEG